MLVRKTLTIELEGPFLTRSNTVGAFGVDAPLARRLCDGKPYIPGSLVLGRLAESIRQLEQARRATAEDSLLQTLFGARDGGGAGDGDSGRSHRRRIFISDLVCKAEKKTPSPGKRNEALRTRTAIDPVTGAIRPGALQVIESPFAAGEIVKFEGELRLILAESELSKDAKVVERIEQALRWIDQWGALRSVGYGVAKSICLAETKGCGGNVAVAGAPRRLRIVLRLHDPLCVGETQTAPNVFTSSDTIPGGVIRGAIANQIVVGAGAKAGTFLSDVAGKLPDVLRPLADNFDRLTFHHARPVVRLDRNATADVPAAVPYSWVSVEIDKEKRLFDLATLRDPARPVLIGGAAPDYEPDWKDAVWGKVSSHLERSDVKTDFRIRTAVDLASRSAAANRLFAIAYRRTDQHDWVAEIDLIPGDDDQSVAARRAVCTALEHALSNGLAGIGRSGAFAEVTMTGVAEADRGSNMVPDSGRLVVTLQTPALLRTPAEQRAGDVTADYRGAFGQLLGDGAKDALTLSAIFVRERLSGAEFMAKRMRAHGGRYAPYLLTKPGSTFVFDFVPTAAALARKAAADTVARWLTTGLPIPPSAAGFYGLTSASHWQFCPFTTGNGYGEIRVTPVSSISDVLVDLIDRNVTAKADYVDVVSLKEAP